MVERWERPDEEREEGLTGIPPRIHWPATPKVEGARETDRIAVEHFFDTLAEVALAVAARRQARHKQAGD